LGEILGGGEIEFYGNFHPGIEGVFRPADQPGVAIPFSLKSYHNVESLFSLLRKIGDASNEAQERGVKNGILYAEPIQFTTKELVDFAVHGPLLKIAKEGAFSRIILKTSDGIVEINQDGVKIIK
jgi:hypothetical protein